MWAPFLLVTKEADVASSTGVTNQAALIGIMVAASDAIDPVA